jgi:hypothetical protein
MEISLDRSIPDTAEKEQSKAADGIVCRGKHLLRALIVKQCATVRVPDVDRDRSDQTNLVVVLNEYDGLCTVGCREGSLIAKLTATDI